MGRGLQGGTPSPDGERRPLALFHAYIIRCLVNGKVYVGITSRSLRARWVEHLYESRRGRSRMTVGAAIAKHGPENFTMEPICCAVSWADICCVERALIAQYECTTPRGYNLRRGGEGIYGHKPSADAIERSAAKHRGKPCHQNTRAAASLYHKGRKKSAETRAKIAAARLGKKHSAATRAWLSRLRMGISQNIGESNGGAKLSAVQVADIRAALVGGATQRGQARKFGVSVTAIWKIANGLKWKPAPLQREETTTP